MKRDEFPKRSVLLTCQSGNTSGLIISAETIGHLERIEVDSSAISGATSILTVKVLDTYTPTGSSAQEFTRKQVSLNCGDVIDVEINGVLLFNQIDVNVNVSGPVVQLGIALE
jgi:hypothetical protein